MSTETEQEIPTRTPSTDTFRWAFGNRELTPREEEIFRAMEQLERGLVQENAALKAQAAPDTARFREMQEAWTRLEADSQMLTWLEKEIGDGAVGALVRVANLMTKTTATFREAIASAMQKEQAP